MDDLRRRVTDLENGRAQDQIWQAEMLASMKEITASVAGVVEFYNTTSSVGKFIRWTSGIGVSALAFWLYVKDAITIN